MAAQKHIAIIGAGISGLTAGYELSRLGYRVTVLEQLDDIGGLARSIPVGLGRLERYYHFICGGDDHLKELVAELGLGPKLHWVPGPTSYYVNGTLYPFTTPLDILRFAPLSLASRIRFGLHGTKARRFTDWRQIESLTAEEWLVSGMGRQAYETIWLPLLRMKFGDDAGQVSAPWIWHRIHRVITSRKSIFRPDDLGYLEGGSWTLLSALAERIEASGGQLRMGEPARAIAERGGRVAGVETDAGLLEADAVISTVPLPALSILLPESAAGYRAELDAIPFLGVVCAMLRMDRSVTDVFWVNVNDARSPFSGFIEYTNLNPCPHLNGEAVAYIPLYLDVNDPRFTMPSAEFGERLVTGLETLFEGFDRSSVREVTITRDSYAQAFCPPGFADRIPHHAAPIPGLFVTDSTQLYPADRNLSGLIGLAQRASALCDEYAAG